MKTPILAFVVNTKCNLKCTKCSLQIPKHPQRDYDFTYLVAQIDVAFKIYDFADEVRITGGEPMLHKNICEILEYICDNYSSQFGRIMLPTNGSYIPKQGLLDIVEKYRDYICVRIDDYGDLSAKADELAIELGKRAIPFELRHYHGDGQNFNDWFDYNDEFRDMNYTDDELKQLYDVCRNMIFSPACWDGKLWGCCFEASGVLLGLIPYTSESEAYLSAVDLLSDEPTEKKREKAALLGTRSFEGCKYCYGLDKEHGKRVPAAEQILEK